MSILYESVARLSEGHYVAERKGEESRIVSNELTEAERAYAHEISILATAIAATRIRAVEAQRDALAAALREIAHLNTVDDPEAIRAIDRCVSAALAKAGV
jgi:hypothetical protein